MKMLLPNLQWLNDHGYGGLRKAMERSPSHFAHIPQVTIRKNKREWVQVAEALEGEHGKLPNTSWLGANGYHGLLSAMSACPELFKHIAREKCFRTPKEWVRIAEELAKKRGQLPCSAWLLKRGLRGLQVCKLSYPHLFAHIPQERKIKSAEEYVSIAEAIAKEHRGLPNSTWMQRNGHGALYVKIRKHPDLFKHVPRRIAA